MVGVGQVEHRVAHQHHQVVILAQIRARQRLVVSFFDHPFSDPLPELFLSGPKLFPIPANHQRRFLLLFFRFLRFLRFALIHVD